MTRHLYLLTGASRGMGAAMADQLAVPGHLLLCLSRGTSESLAQAAARRGASVTQWSCDLEDAPAAAARLQAWLAEQREADFASATLINNAGTLAALKPLAASDPASLTRALRVGLEAPMLLTAAFLHATQAWRMPRKVLNISSGLGRRAMAAQSGYCAAKAGMDHFTRCVALEEAASPNGARVCSLAPGVIDTGMQDQLRSAADEDFADRANFESLKTRGLLATPQDAAARVLAWLDRPDFGAEPVADVRG
jgi:NAD(P)-dependent dehydrogenase (short-subunit alcohol dehydrogenase family)